MTTDLKDPAVVLARTIWGEARDQGQAGMLAVAWVVHNRATHPRWWGDSVLSVCLEPFQFSCWNAFDSNHAKLLAVTRADPQYAQAQTIAAQIMSGHTADPTRNADSYFAASIPAPSWASRAAFTTQIGAHRFYRVELAAPYTITPAKPHGDPLAPNIITTADLNDAEYNRIIQR